MFLPTSTVHLDPHFKEYYQKLVEAIELDTEAYSHVSQEILTQSKAIGFVGELHMCPSGNKWILTAVCPYSNYLRAISVPDKTATTAANALVNDVFLSTSFPSVLQSDCGGEWLNALLHRITKLLSIKHVFTSGFRPRLNSAMECTHRFLNTALRIFCEKQQENGNSFYNLQFMHTMCPPFQVLLTLHHFSLFLAAMLPLQKPYLCNSQFIHYHQITMQNILSHSYRVLIKILLWSKQISVANRKIFMTRKLVSFLFQMARSLCLKRTTHHIYQALQHVL